MSDQLNRLVQAYLVAYPAEKFTNPILLVSGRNTIGRERSCTVQIADDSVSPQHAVITNAQGNYLITDLDTPAGTFVNQERVKQTALNHRDKISLGNRTFLFLTKGDLHENSDAELNFDENDTIVISEDEFEPSELLAQLATSTPDEAFRPTLPAKAADVNIARALRAHQRLSLLYELREKLYNVEDLKQILELGVDFILEAIETAERVMILHRSPETGSLSMQVLRFRDQRQTGKTIPISRTLLNWVVTERMALVSPNVADDLRFQASESIRVQNLNAILCVPMMNADRVDGIIYLDCQTLMSQLTQEDVAFAGAVANDLALRIENVRLQREALKNERMAAIGMTMTNLSHNIKNLLMLNQNTVDLMAMQLRRIDDEKLNQNWSRIQQSFSQINRLSVEMLDYAKEPDLKARPVDINRTILANREYFEQSLSHKNIAFGLILSEANPTWIMDTTQLLRAMINLVVNAIDAVAGRKNPRIELKTEVQDNHLVISVTDNGCGINPENQNKIFDIFYTSKGVSGSGLGLPMVLKFVEGMGGSLQVKSKPDVGSAFKMIFPKKSQK
jgi:signal transduction histidine kinase